MVRNATGLTGSGFRDWLLQRITGAFLGIYFVCLVSYLLLAPTITFDSWHTVFQCAIVKGATLMVLLSLIAHAWIGLWSVVTDYIHCVCLRLTIQIFFITALLAFLIWGIAIVWGV